MISSRKRENTDRTSASQVVIHTLWSTSSMLVFLGNSGTGASWAAAAAGDDEDDLVASFPTLALAWLSEAVETEEFCCRGTGAFCASPKSTRANLRQQTTPLGPFGNWGYMAGRARPPATKCPETANWSELLPDYIPRPSAQVKLQNGCLHEKYIM